MSGSLPVKPARLEVLTENIPERIRRLARWIVWNWVRRKEKWDKPPLQLSSDFASVSDPATWTTFDRALAAHRAGQFDGVGFVLGRVEEDDATYVGLDLDGCRDPETGELQDWAVSHLQLLGTYAEVSPSGRGVKALAFGSLPGPDRNESSHLGVEMYAGGRYFTVTGHRLPDAPPELAERTAELAELDYLIFGEVKKETFTAQSPDAIPDRDLALSALQGLNHSLAVGYGDWLRVGMALYSVAADAEMLSAWDSWSRNCTEKFREGECAKKWQSFGTKGGLGLGSLIYWAKQNGWTHPRSRRQAESSAKSDSAILNRLDSRLSEGVEAFFRDRELLEALARLAETDAPEFACVRAKLQKAKISLRDFDASLAPFRRNIRAERPPLESSGSYRIVAGRIVNLRTTRDGPVEVPLANWSGRIVEEVVHDDGAERRISLAVEGALADGTPLSPAIVTAEQFPFMRWPVVEWGTRAVVFAGASTADHLRVALQLLSGDVPRRLVYGHTGWRKIGDGWMYLHGGGAIGPAGIAETVVVELPDALTGFELPAPPERDELVHAVRASLRLLDVGPDRITVPVFAATYRAALAASDFALHLAGSSGAFKTELAALAQQHFGASLDSRNLKGSWTSTGNALEGLAFAAKDSLFVVDDFCPAGAVADVQRYHKDADRLFRGQGNRAGRGRCRADGSLKSGKAPRGLILSTGEEIPRGQSLRARLFVIELSKKDISPAKLTVAQRDAAAGRFASSMSGFIQWLVRRYDHVHSDLRREHAELRERALDGLDGQHARTPGQVADLALGMKYFLAFALEAGAISAEERDTLARRCWAALGEAAGAQVEHIRTAEPCELFLRLLSAAISSGRAHVAGPDGLEPSNPEAWGWQGKEYTHRVAGNAAATETDISYLPKGNKVGWIDGNDLYLEPESAYAAVQELARQQGESMPVAPRTLWQRLKERGLLASWDAERQRNTVRRSLGGVLARNVLHLREDTLSSSTRPSTPSNRPTEPRQTREKWPVDVDGPMDGPTAPPKQPSTATGHFSTEGDVSGRCGRSKTDSEASAANGERSHARFTVEATGKSDGAGSPPVPPERRKGSL